jgi:hypothetical protein
VVVKEAVMELTADANITGQQPNRLVGARSKAAHSHTIIKDNHQVSPTRAAGETWLTMSHRMVR